MRTPRTSWHQTGFWPIGVPFIASRSYTSLAPLETREVAMSTEGLSFESWLERARLRRERLDAHQISVLEAAFRFLEHGLAKRCPFSGWIPRMFVALTVATKQASGTTFARWSSNVVQPGSFRRSPTSSRLVESVTKARAIARGGNGCSERQSCLRPGEACRISPSESLACQQDKQGTPPASGGVP